MQIKFPDSNLAWTVVLTMQNHHEVSLLTLVPIIFSKHNYMLVVKHYRYCYNQKVEMACNFGHSYALMTTNPLPMLLFKLETLRSVSHFDYWQNICSKVQKEEEWYKSLDIVK